MKVSMAIRQTSPDRVLFVDDEPNVLNAIRRLFRDKDMQVLLAGSPHDALSLVEREEIAVVVSDNLMPGMYGVELLSRIKAISPHTVKILMTAHVDLQTAIDAINTSDAIRFIIKPWENNVLIGAVEEGLQRYRMAASLRIADEGTLLSLAQTIELKDPYTRGHCNRVARYALLMADALRLSQADRTEITYGSWLHDCGKIGVPERILNKPGPLDPEEMEVVKKHPLWGAEVARLARLSETVVNVISFHHEKLDGTGYPYGRKGADIPLEARIVSIADIFDAITTDRPYQKALSFSRAAQILLSMRGSALDPDILDLFLSGMHRLSDEGVGS